MGKKGGSTTVQSYKPTEQEIRLQKQAADYSEAVAPNALWLNNVARNMLEDSMGTVKVDYNSLNADALNQISGAQKGLYGLTQGSLPAEYQKNMENSIRSGVENTMGEMMQGLGARGVLNSSVTNKAMNDMSKNVSDTMAQQYNTNISTLNGLYGQQASLAPQSISTSAAAQEAARAPSLDYWNASMGLNNGGTLGALQAVAGQGNTTSTTTGANGGLFGSILSPIAQGVGAYYGAACFAENTKVKTPDGEKEIRHIKVGDKVITHADDNDVIEDVIDVMKPRYSDIFVVITDGKHMVHTTSTQPLLTADGNMVKVADLTLGTELKGVGKVDGIMYSGERKVYDFKTSGTNRYYANGFVAQGQY